ncbi:MAG: DegT/DnrJ/EryC1/StrS aminotransferase family protein [Coriobacteriia bacterium]|nr:DegT/DnrJ/EryC1/StrS aminotransferase family protein [Coriobacteriia bacterium]
MSVLLAIDGGEPVVREPFPTWPAFDDEAIAEVDRVIRSGRLTYWSGEHGRMLEDEFAALLGRRHGIAVANGTIALELALRAFGIGPGDEVVVPARTFIATASAVVAVGATPRVADVDPLTGCLTAATVAPLINERTRGIIPVHLGGWPVDLDPVVSLARRNGLLVIEDCAQAHGARYRGAFVGGRGTDAAVFSFCHDKIVPAGEGGFVALDDDDAYRAAWSYKDHGRSPATRTRPADTAHGTDFIWLVERFGTNGRMPEVSAALARHGLRLLPQWVARRREHARVLREALSDVPGIIVPAELPGAEPSYYRFYAFVVPDALHRGWDRSRVAQAIAAEGVPVSYGACAEIYRERAFVDAGWAPTERLPGAMRAHETSLAFPVHPMLEASHLEATAAAVAKVMEVAAR